MNPRLIEIQMLDHETEDYGYVDSFDDPFIAKGAITYLRESYPDEEYRLIEVIG